MNKHNWPVPIYAVAEGASQIDLLTNTTSLAQFRITANARLRRDKTIIAGWKLGMRWESHQPQSRKQADLILKGDIADIASHTMFFQESSRHKIPTKTSRLKRYGNFCRHGSFFPTRRGSRLRSFVGGCEGHIESLISAFAKKKAQKTEDSPISHS